MSTPGHPSYGAHMDRDEINAMLNPADESASLVLDWLKAFGIIGVYDKHWIKADITVARAQKLLQTQYNVYLNSVNGKTVVRTPSYSLPSILFDHVDLVQPTTMFAGFRDQFVDSTDLKNFLQKFRPDAAAEELKFTVINNGENIQGKPSEQANLNAQYSVGLASPTKVTFFSVGGRGVQFGPDGNPLLEKDSTNEPFLELLQWLLEQPDGELPHTLVLPYSDQEQSVPRAYARKVCEQLGVLAGRDVSVIVPSGDNGVGKSPCQTNDGSNRPLFQATFPASCPWVTSVGGTTGTSPEVAASSSGGGFSQHFERPDWQNPAVTTFLENLGGQYDGRFTRSGRAIPDVSALSTNFQVVVEGRTGTSGGSACSATVFGAIISLINDRRIRAGKKPLGWLNLGLYSSEGSAAFNDITSGTNPGCDTDGFSAAKGWDPVTGFGTPDFAKLLPALMNL
ncbi:hypothetical protein EC968_007008 [Mortierella alpina]|nr:hypothetical protein EC968_007008 [Mortierella alpina]